MKKYEYRILSRENSGDMEDLLNAYGAQGWRVSSQAAVPFRTDRGDTTRSYWIVIVEREIGVP